LQEPPSRHADRRVDRWTERVRMISPGDSGKYRAKLAEYVKRAEAANEKLRKSLEELRKREPNDETQKEPEKASIIQRLKETQEKFASFGSKEA
ncbi:MAG: hypothetical protein M1587_04095, partial [Thaumarchaeota archaeon]|nr:hypothetical protein [Nitrososphaerota archaeon]